MESIEIWKPIVGCEGFYEINNYGKPRSVERFIIDKIGRTYHKKSVELSTGTTGDGYPMFVVCIKGKTKPLLAHRAMMEAFVPNPLNLPEINHRDENPSNNFIFVNPDGSVDLEKSNLEWCDRTYNVNYGTARERAIENIHKYWDEHRKPPKEKKRKPVLQYTLEGEYITEYKDKETAAKSVKCTRENISYACNRSDTHYAKGYLWYNKT